MENRTAALGKQLVLDAVFAFVDVETTGLSTEKGGRVCEVAVLRNRGELRLESFDTLINPLCVISEEITGINGIDNAMVAASPVFSRIAPKLISLLEDAVVVCHNASFDVGFLACEFHAAGLRFPPVPIIDTLILARKHWRFQSNRLGSIARELGISAEGWHRALSDVVMTEKIFLHFLKEFTGRGAKTVDDLLALH